MFPLLMKFLLNQCLSFKHYKYHVHQFSKMNLQSFILKLGVSQRLAKYNYYDKSKIKVKINSFKILNILTPGID